MKKQIEFSPVARRDLVNGVNLLGQAVVTTLGPKGRNVGLGRKWNAPKVVHDGVSVAKEISSNNPFEDMGIQLARDAASQTNDVAGDGTTTSILLTQAIVNEGYREITEGANPMMIQRGLNKSVELVLEELKRRSITVENEEMVAQIGTLSAADETVGRLISEAISKVGKKGIVTVEKGHGVSTIVEYKEGMEFDRGFISSGFITNQERSICEVENAYVVLVADRISRNSQLMPILNAIAQKENQAHFGVVIIADKVDYEALGSLVGNHLSGRISALAIESPGFGDKRTELLEDIAILTGGKVIKPSEGFDFSKDVDVNMFGRAGKIITSKESTKVIDGKGESEAISLRIAQIEKRIEEEKNDFEKEKLEERVARLAASAAIIYVGAPTETELHDRRERVIDAVAATKAAIEEGILPGGGVSLLKARDVLAEYGKDLDEDERKGAEILYRALKKPIIKLFENADIPRSALKEIEASKVSDYGLNVIDGKFGSLIEMGIIDPTKVVRTAVRNATSVAGIILTTEVLVAPEEESKN